jgi:peptidoglycan/LPS O-acetylase OafA/YrhL
MAWGPGRPDVSVRDVISQAFLVGDVMATQLLDLVSWTLHIELKFYLISALIAASLVRNELRGIYVFVLVSVVGAALHRWPAFNQLLSASIGPNAPFIYKQLFVQAGFVVYIFCGYVFLLYYEKQISLRHALLNASVLHLLSIGIEQLRSVPASVLNSVAWNQLLAICIFLPHYSGIADTEVLSAWIL